MDFEIRRLIHYDESSVSEELHRIWNLLGKKDFTYDEFKNAGGKVTDQTVRKLFGSWNAGLLKAGIPVRRKMNIEDEELMREFHKVVEKFKRKPTFNEFKYNSKYSINCYVKRYGSFLQACKRYLDWLSPDKEKQYTPKNNSRKRTKRESLTKSKRFDVFLRDNFTCQYCGKHPPDIKLEVDHVMPSSQEGSNSMSNLITSCYECNRGKRNKNISSRIAAMDRIHEQISTKHVTL